MNRRQRKAKKRRTEYERRRNIARSRPKAERGVPTGAHLKVRGARVEINQLNAIRGSK